MKKEEDEGRDEEEGRGSGGGEGGGWKEGTALLIGLSPMCQALCGDYF